MITGRVRDVTTGNGLSGWVVSVTGPTNLSVTTDGNGNYVLNGLAPGAYVVCETLQSGWGQTSPVFPNPCGSGMGYNFSLIAGGSAQFVDFGNSPL
ncbi:MAG TPA: carboxypeptidase regulatory-like domain-containing protein [Gemmatimonadales bacterium]|jgi:hypothetical protein|nr:carboxypeptidase regulatory-like domain-containing protein [Gemmatimonadales bacterium]